MAIDELDPTTARLVSELATQMLPSLTKALNSAVPADQFANALERTNRMSQELRSHIEKSIRSSIEDSRAGRSMLMQSMASMLEEFTNLKRLIEKLPDKLTGISTGLENVIKSAAENHDSSNNIHENNNILQELSNIQEMLSELVKGLQTFSEKYSRENQPAQQKINPPDNKSQIINEPDHRLDKLINNSFPGLEGLIKANGRTHSKELEELSREISASQEQNNIALVHEIREAVNEELANFSGTHSSQTKQPSSLTTKILAAMSGTCIIFMGIIIYLLLR